MTAARKDIFCPEEEGFFHCISRCVRRAFLCGIDSYSGKSFEHRKRWVKWRLKQLLEIFAIECLAYAVMSNHLHTVLRNRPDTVSAWTDDEVARRWRLLFPRRRRGDGAPEKPSEQEIREITSDKALVRKYRSRLCDISWFNRCLNENLARRANAEDECTGRFWEGRFKAIRLEDAGGILACSVYVDLNPVRAGTARSLKGSDYTSIQDRIKTLASGLSRGPRLLSHDEVVLHGFSSEQYIRLVEETGKMLVDGKHQLPPNLASVIERLNLRPEGWRSNARDQSRLFQRIVGSVESIRRFAASRKKAWFQGLGAARLVFAQG